MDWTPEEIKKLVKKFGGVAVMAEIMRVKPHTIQNMIYGERSPSTGAGVALFNLLSILERTLNEAELTDLLIALRDENKKSPQRSRKR